MATTSMTRGLTRHSLARLGCPPALGQAEILTPRAVTTPHDAMASPEAMDHALAPWSIIPSKNTTTSGISVNAVGN